VQALIVGDGESPSEKLFHDELQQSDLLLAADGGTYTCLGFDVYPDLAVGDMDSYPPDEERFPVKQVSDQETNDIEKALHVAVGKGVEDVVLMGVTGLRLDHTMKNLSLLKRFQGSFNSLIIKDNYGNTFLLPRTATLDLPVSTTVSLIPLSGKVTNITLEGFKYPLQNETLENGVRDGTSNLITETPAGITYETGDLLAFVHHPEREQQT